MESIPPETPTRTVSSGLIRHPSRSAAETRAEIEAFMDLHQVAEERLRADDDAGQGRPGVGAQHGRYRDGVFKGTF